ncbi:ketoacyl-ACP synthase III family protein [Clostridium sp. D2Q-11]|uniref:Ketoacyl-ACP synthase III family protein n=1 Tax=Anaeromonas frigoriresistens TaxID=2683708 RepID=A0A942USH4_9FIRM|nr:glycine/sarcosine/betaine reductase complex component C subunit beta [Anaeromonas frigoriresistens]MBS4537778.1 ketoacyl-ACP synthase III family protein [Anaeromonas frigoriresistens]
MSFSVINGSSYVLVHTPDMIIHNGTTQTMERHVNPDSEYLKKIPNHLRSYEDVVSYPANQTYIGNMTPEKLGEYDLPWFDKKVEGAERFGKFGEIMPQDEFIGLMKIVDVFDLVLLDNSFTDMVREKLTNHPLMTDELVNGLKAGEEIATIEKEINENHAEALYNDGKIVGCVKRAHDIDVNLNAHVIFENLVVKASGVLSMLNLLAKNDINPESIDYVIECSEEACGDMNQRGGGNFAKAIAETTGCINATGSDTRGFCAAPTHSLIEAAALVQAGVYENVVIVAGGATAKLGMNGKDHIKKEMPILEDVLGGFAVLISKNDGVNPVIRTDLVGRHTVGTGSSPQAVITALITAPLDKGDLKITDIDKYSVEMQNPDITKPAGAGDVPTSNYKMIGALGVKRQELERKELMNFVTGHGMPGWAPTQGHIPSGVPYIGFAREEMLAGNINKAMIVGKGSLFLGRMTNLFDGVSVVIEKNNGVVDEVAGVSEEKIRGMVAEAMRDFASHLLK